MWELASAKVFDLQSHEHVDDSPSLPLPSSATVRDMPSTWTHTFEQGIFKGTVDVSTGLFINGQFVDSLAQKTIE